MASIGPALQPQGTLAGPSSWSTDLPSSVTAPPALPLAARQKFELLQVFRGLTALGVLVFHLTVRMYQELNIPLVGSLLPAQSGVDFFFVLSGFIIFHAHRDDLGRPDQMKRFAKRRFVRIYPLYLIMTLAVLTLYLMGWGHSYKTTVPIILKSLVMFPQEPGIYPILNVGWTLCHEAFFYALFGFAIALKPRITWLLLAPFVAITVAGMVIQLPGPYWVPKWVFSPYNLEFMGGCAAAYIAGRRLNWMLFAGAALLAGVWIYAGVTGMQMGGAVAGRMVLLFGFPYWLIVTGAASIEWGRVIPVPRSLTSLGDATYSIYLSHFLILAILVAVVKKLAIPPLAGGIAITLVTTALGYAMHRVLEAPLLKRVRSF